MSERARKINLHPSVARRSEGSLCLKASGDAVLVERGVLRLLALTCPCGCGEELSINLDPRTDKAWRLYRRSRGFTLFPSIHRTTGCESHFIIWNDEIYWIGDDNASRELSKVDLALDGVVENRLNLLEFRTFVEVADELDEIPWAVLRACIRLVAAGKATRGEDRLRSSFKRLDNPADIR